MNFVVNVKTFKKLPYDALGHQITAPLPPNHVSIPALMVETFLSQCCAPDKLTHLPVVAHLSPVRFDGQQECRVHVVFLDRQSPGV